MLGMTTSIQVVLASVNNAQQAFLAPLPGKVDLLIGMNKK